MNASAIVPVLGPMISLATLLFIVRIGTRFGVVRVRMLEIEIIRVTERFAVCDER